MKTIVTRSRTRQISRARCRHVRLGFEQLDLDQTFGISNRGTIHGVSFRELVAVFGQPNYNTLDEKVTTGWAIRFSDGTVAAIYDYRETRKFSPDLPTVAQFRRHNRSWNIGGFTFRALYHVSHFLGLPARR